MAFDRNIRFQLRCVPILERLLDVEFQSTPIISENFVQGLALGDATEKIHSLGNEIAVLPLPYLRSDRHNRRFDVPYKNSGRSVNDDRTDLPSHPIRLTRLRPVNSGPTTREPLCSGKSRMGLDRTNLSTRSGTISRAYSGPSLRQILSNYVRL